jgi:hypothetical protein
VWQLLGVEKIQNGGRCHGNHCTLVTMAMAAILNLFNPKSCHTLQWIFLQSFMKFDDGQTATVAMETKKGGIYFFFNSFHQTS